MKSWLLSYTDYHNIVGIADGNGEITKLLDLVSDKSSNFMGLRCTRFAMIVDNNIISKNYLLKSPANLMLVQQKIFYLSYNL